jgi:hypothetical protein
MISGNFFSNLFLSLEPTNLTNKLYENFSSIFFWIQILVAFVYAVAFFMMESLVKQRSDSKILSNLDNKPEIIQKNIAQLMKTNPELFKYGSNMFVNFMPNSYDRVPQVAIDLERSSITELLYTGGMTIYLITVIITGLVMINTAQNYNYPNMTVSIILFFVFLLIPFVLYILAKLSISYYEKIAFLQKLPKYYYTDYNLLYMTCALIFILLIYVGIILWKEYVNWRLIILAIITAVLILFCRYILFGPTKFLSLLMTRLFGVNPMPKGLRDTVVGQFIWFVIMITILPLIIMKIVGYFAYKDNIMDISAHNKK